MLRRFRPNILILMGFAYSTTLAGFVTLVYTGASPDAAYEAIKSPLMALIGGTIGVAKDVLKADDEPAK